MTRAKKETNSTASKYDMFTAAVKAALHVECVKEFRFHPIRKWRYDYAILEHKIALEVEGGVWTEGRHTRPRGFLGDIEKYNSGTIMGWMILRTTPDRLLTKGTIDMLRLAIVYRNFGRTKKNE
jgi:very-short-patch-repair endonuclease